MPTPDFDNILLGQYIRAIENPDSIGYANGKWYQSPRKVDDPNNRGFGIDVKYNKAAKEIVKDRPGEWLSAEEERNLRNSYIDNLQKTIERKHVPNFGGEGISPKKRVMATGLLYRGDGINTNPELKEAYYNGSDNDFQEAVTNYYKRKGLKERARLHNEFMNLYDERIAGPKEVSDNYFQILGSQPTISSVLKSDGGYVSKTKDKWNSLSLKEKAEMMKVAVQNGVYDLSEIRKAYNEYAEGGETDDNNILDLSDRGYKSKRDLLITGIPNQFGTQPFVSGSIFGLMRNPIIRNGYKVLGKAANFAGNVTRRGYEVAGRKIIDAVPKNAKEPVKYALDGLYNAFVGNAKNKYMYPNTEYVPRSIDMIDKIFNNEEE